ncbi:MAG: hypothetical protein KAX50_10045 [Saprospiraceae bacterium]|nr:hypothetical protein [Saprospiraceae bacterium]
MQETITQENLKEALLELVHSDRQFVLSLVEELTSSASQYFSDNQAVLSSDPIVPYYRQDINTAFPKAALDQQTMDRLRALFADRPTAEAPLEVISF